MRSAAHGVARAHVLAQATPLPARYRERRVRRPARLVESQAAQRLQGDLRAVRGRQAGRDSRRRPDRLRQRGRRGAGPAGRRRDRQGRRAAGRRRCRQCGVARHASGRRRGAVAYAPTFSPHREERSRRLSVSKDAAMLLRHAGLTLRDALAARALLRVRGARKSLQLVFLLHRVERVLADEALTLGEIDGERRGVADLPLFA